MNARQRFDLTIQRAYMLWAFYGNYEEQAHDMFGQSVADVRLRGQRIPGHGPEPEHERTYSAVLSDGIRIALVLAVSAMDTYFTDKYVEAFIPHLKKRGPNKEMAEFCANAKIDVLVALELLRKKRPLDSLRAHVGQYLSSYVAQNVDRVDKLYLTIDLKNLSQHAQAKAHRKPLVRRVVAAVKRRHEITHSGDTTKEGHLRKISPSAVVEALDSIKLFVWNCDDIINHSVGKASAPRPTPDD
jgi:hypothetical protein